MLFLGSRPGEDLERQDSGSFPYDFVLKARRLLRSYLSDKQESRFFLAVSEVSTIAGNEFFALLFILIHSFDLDVTFFSFEELF